MVDPLIPPAGKPQVPVSGARAGMLARYELRRLLAASASAQVWQGYDQRLGRDVRVKLFQPGRDVDAREDAYPPENSMHVRLVAGSYLHAPAKMTAVTIVVTSLHVLMIGSDHLRIMQ